MRRGEASTVRRPSPRLRGEGGAQRRVRGACVIAILLFALPLFAAEKWVEAYNRGVAAVNASNYKLGASELQKAIAEMPTEGVGVRTRSTIITYVPHFWLGIAKFNLGDVDGALREWRTSEEQGAIARTEYYANLKNWLARAQVEKKRLAQNAASGSKKTAADAISRALALQVEALSAGGDRTDSYRSAQKLLQEANGQYNRGGTDIDAYNDAAQTANKAIALFTAAAEEGRRLRAARPAIPKQQPKPADVVVPKPEPPKPAPIPVVDQPKPEPVKPAEPPAPVISKAEEDASRALQQYRRNLGDALRAARGNDKLLSVLRRENRDVDQLRARLEKANGDAEFESIARTAADRDEALAKRIAESKQPAVVPAPEPEPVPTPAAPVQTANDDLRFAYRAFATGDLASSESLLTKLLGERPSGEAYLLRGCARYTRAMLSRSPEALLDAATQDFRAALQQNRALRLDSRAFSPKLIAFFEDVRSRTN